MLLDLVASSLAAITHALIDQMIYEGQIKPQDQEDILRTLLLQHKYGWHWWPHRSDPGVRAGPGLSESCWSLAQGGKAPLCLGFASQPCPGVRTRPWGWGCLAGV